MAPSVLTPKQAELPGKQGWIIIAYRSTFEENSEELEPLKKKKNQEKEIRIQDEKKWIGRNKQCKRKTYS